MRTNKQRSGIRGFSLVELSVVLLIVSSVLAGGIAVTIRNVDQTQQDDTKRRMAIIEEALDHFRKANDRLPCPADITLATGSAGFAVEAATPGTCTGSTVLTGLTNDARGGGVPTTTLGLPDEFSFDGWGRKFYYAVDVRMTATTSFTNHPESDATVGNIIVNDASGNDRTNGGRAIYTLLSHGKNGHCSYGPNGARKNSGSADASELENGNCDASAAVGTVNNIFVQKQFTENLASPSNQFDDLVIFRLRSYFKDTAGPIAPTITVVTPPGDATYPQSSVMNLQFTFSEAVTVTGTPRVAVTVGAATRYFDYFSGSGTTVLKFEYYPLAGDADANGVAIASPIDLNGGTIKNAATVNANLTFAAPATPGALVDTAAPAAWVMVPAATLPDSVTNVPAFRVMAYEAKNVAGTATSQPASKPWDNLDFPTAKAACTAIGGGARLIRENEWLAIAHNLKRQPSNWTSGIVGTDQLVRGHSDWGSGMTGDGPAGADNAGAGTDGYVNTGNAVTDATGDGREQRRTMALSNGGIIWDFPGNAAEFVYCNDGVAGCDGSGRMTSVQAYLDPTNLVKINGETNDAGFTNLNVKSIYTHSNSVGFIGAVGGWPVIQRGGFSESGDGAAGILGFTTQTNVVTRDDYGFRCTKPAYDPPTVTVVTPPGDATYPQSSTMNLQFTFSEAVTVTGTPRVPVDVGGSAQNFSYVSGSGTTTLTFQYNVAAGLADANGVAISSPIDLNGGTIQSTANGTDSDLTFVAPATPNVLVNTSAPAAWVAVPARTLPDGVTNVSAFEVMAYPAKDVAGVATSQAGSTPWAGANYSEAAGYCSALGAGARLMRDREYLSIIQNAIVQPSSWSSGIIGTGYLMRGHVDNNPGNALNAGAGTDGYSGTGNAVTQAAGSGREQRRTIALSNGSILWDITGNVYQWTSCESGVTGCHATDGSMSSPRQYVDPTNNTLAGGAYESNHAGITNANVKSIYTSANGAGQITFSNVAGWFITRGGKWDGPGAYGGLLDFYASPSIWSGQIGFRCTRPAGGGAPTITVVTPPGNATYPQSSVMNLQLTFSQAVTVTGTPRVAVTVGAATRYFNYVSGTGTTQLKFEYYPQAGDADSDGVAIASPVDLNGGTIRNASASDAILTFTAPATPSVKVDTAAPAGWVTVPAVTLPDGVTNVASFEVFAYEAKNVAGTATSQTGSAPWTSITWTNAAAACTALGSSAHLIKETEWLAIAQNATTQASNWSSGIVGTGMLMRGNSDAAPASTLAATGGVDGYTGTGNAVTDAAGSGREQRRTLALSNGSILWDFAGNAYEFSYCDNAVTGCNGAGGISGRQYVDPVSNAIANGFYDYNSAAITNSNLKPTGGYTHASNKTGSLYSVNTAGNIILRGGTYSDIEAGIFYFNNSFGGPGGSQANIGYRCARPVLTAPVVSVVTPPGDAYYPQSSVMNLQFTFDQAVTVTGTPRVAVVVGAATRYFNYVSGTGTTQLKFEYYPQAGDTDNDGVAIASPIDLNGGTIRNAGAMDATLTFVAPATPNVKVLTAAPGAWVTVPASTLPNGAVIAAFQVMAYEARDVAGTATSQAANTPWHTITWANINTACTALAGPARLMTVNEFWSIVHNAAAQPSNWSSGIVGTGYLMRGHTDNNPANKLNSGTGADGYSGTGNAVTDAAGSGREQRRTFALSNGSILWDISGNVLEPIYCTGSGCNGAGLSNSGQNFFDPSTGTIANGTYEFNSAAITRTNVKPVGGYTSANGAGVAVVAPGAANVVLTGGAWTGALEPSVAAAGMFAIGNIGTGAGGTHTGFRCTKP